MEVKTNDLSSGLSGEAWRVSWGFVVENRLPAFVVAVLVPAVVACIQFNWASPEMRTALITAVWTLVVYFGICLAVYLFFLLYRVPKRRLIEAGKLIGEGLTKMASLEDRMKSRIRVSCGKSVDKSVVPVQGEVWFRAKLDLEGCVPIPDIEAAVTELWEDKQKVSLHENLILTMFPGPGPAPDLRIRNEGKSEFVDIIRVFPNRTAIFPQKFYSRAVDQPALLKPNHAYRITIAIYSLSFANRTIIGTFEFDWTGDPETSDIRLISVTPPSPIPGRATLQHSLTP